MSTVWLRSLFALGWFVFLLWEASVMTLVLMPARWRHPLFDVFRVELRPFALPGLLVAFAVDAFTRGPLDAWDYFSLSMNLLGWWLWRRHDKDDDDRWKRRRQKLADTVAEVGGKLQVVPAASPP